MVEPHDDQNRETSFPFGSTIERPSIWLHILIFAITLSAVLITILLAHRSYTHNRLTALNDFNGQQLVLARSAAAGIETLFAEVKAALSAAASLPAVRKMSPECLDYMRHMSGGFLPKTSIRRLDERGILRFIYPHDDWRKDLLGRDFSDSESFQNAREEVTVTASRVVINEQGERRLRVAAPVFMNGPDEELPRIFKGVLIVSFDIGAITNAFISPITPGKTGYAWLINQDGNVIAHHDSQYVGRDVFTLWAEQKFILSPQSADTILQNMKTGREGTDLYLSKQHRGETATIQKLIAYSPVRILDHVWSVAVVTPAGEVDRIIRSTIRKTMYGFGFIVLVLVGAGSFFSVTAYRWSYSLQREVRNRTKELKEATDYLDNLIRNANTPIVVWDTGRRITIFNRAFETMSGWTTAEIAGQPLNVLFPDERHITMLETASPAEENGPVEAQEIPIVMKDGERRIGMWTSSRIHADDGTTLIATLAHGEDITERKKTEEALRQSEAYYRAVVEAQTELICRYTPDFRITFVNEAYCRYFNKSQQELIDTSFMPLIPEEAQKRVETILHDLRTKKIPEIRIEHPVVNGKGELRWQQWTNRALFDDHDRVIEYQSVGRDITELKRVEEMLTRTMRNLSMAQEIAAMGSWEWDIGTDEVLWSDETYRLFGLKPRGIKVNLSSYIQRVHPEDADKVRCALREARDKKQPYESEHRIIRKDGSVRIHHLKGEIVLDDCGVPIKQTGIVQDITDRRRSEERLRLTQQSVDAASISIFWITPEGNFIYSNDAASANLGYSHDELCAMNVSDIDPDFPAVKRRAHWENLKTRKVMTFESHHRTKDGRIFPVDITNNYLQFNDQEYEIAFAVNISERKLAEEEKKKLEAQLYHSQKIDTLGALVAGVAHEINNPVNKIIFDIPLLKKIWIDILPVLAAQTRKEPHQKYGGLTYEFLKENLPEMLSDMELATNRVAKTVSNLKDYTRKSSIADRRPMRINTAVENAIRLIETTIKKAGIDLTTNLRDTLPMIDGNTQSIEQIIINIVVNAIQAIDHDHGHIDIATGSMEEGRLVFIAISDNGEGIDPFISDKIFDPFITNRHNSGGTGLGLAITRNLVEAHGGDITFTSTRGEGTIFTVVFPTTGLESWW